MSWPIDEDLNYETDMELFFSSSNQKQSFYRLVILSPHWMFPRIKALSQRKKVDLSLANLISHMSDNCIAALSNCQPQENLVFT
ncbi:hypothetical protein CEXT_610001 [Caerostris extrusa]|uniref:Uncharacterized protein n=1 Tax=Caerostris extrusa TaxID=172846 RepID=A0AAV4WF00_CAEEX|nr:hypothetical protein CEXT_610001 [Caerostris extrusa]